MRGEEEGRGEGKVIISSGSLSSYERKDKRETDNIDSRGYNHLWDCCFGCCSFGFRELGKVGRFISLNPFNNA